MIDRGGSESFYFKFFYIFWFLNYVNILNIFLKSDLGREENKKLKEYNKS